MSFDESKPVPGEVEGGEGGEVVKAGGGQAEGDQGDHQDEKDMMLVTFINMALILNLHHGDGCGVGDIVPNEVPQLTLGKPVSPNLDEFLENPQRGGGSFLI